MSYHHQLDGKKYKQSQCDFGVNHFEQQQRFHRADLILMSNAYAMVHFYSAKFHP